MTVAQNMLDRVRLERAVWSLDARLQDLPRRSRITKRRELRANLRAAAAEVGIRRAVSQLGDLRGLAADYLEAEYGELWRRPSWYAAALALLLVDLFMLTLDHVGRSAFQAAITASTPHATGTFHWHGVPYLMSNDATFTYVDGKSSSVGGAWTPLVYALMLAAAVIAGRLWRLMPALRRRRITSSHTASDTQMP